MYVLGPSIAVQILWGRNLYSCLFTKLWTLANTSSCWLAVIMCTEYPDVLFRTQRPDRARAWYWPTSVRCLLTATLGLPTSTLISRHCTLLFLIVRFSYTLLVFRSFCCLPPYLLCIFRRNLLQRVLMYSVQFFCNAFFLWFRESVIPKPCSVYSNKITTITQNYWVSGLCPSSGIPNTRKNVSETGSVSILR
jgi:hypothetical protein